MLGYCFVGLVAFCLLLTQSKGAYVACAGGLVLLLMFKRPIWAQLMIACLAFGLGLTALKALPRMDTLSKKDPGIMGRMVVWQQAKASMKSGLTGAGLKQFQGYISERNARLHRTVYIQIATHGSYVRHGADLGYVGLMLYAGVFYAGARTLIQAKVPEHADYRRVQRTLFTLVTCMALSCWMVDRAYHMDYFVLSGALSAFHRKFLRASRSGNEELGRDGMADLPLESSNPRLAFASKAHRAGWASVKKPSSYGQEGATAFVLKWDRFGIVDLCLMVILTEVIVYYWDLLSTDFITF